MPLVKAAGAVLIPNSQFQRRPCCSAAKSAAIPADAGINSNKAPTRSRLRRKPHSEETKRKISEARKGKRHSEETKEKISQAMRALPQKSIVHRFRISQAKLNTTHSLETREKIGIAVAATKRRLKRQRLAARAAEAAEAATADLRPVFNLLANTEENEDEDTEGDQIVLDYLELEKTVIELTSLRRQLTSWMDAYERKYGHKPNLTEASETNPLVYGRFVRYVALRELVRRSSLAIGSTPVSWT